MGIQKIDRKKFKVESDTGEAGIRMADEDRKITAIQRLSGRMNYDEWKVAAKSYLIIKGLWNVVSAEHPESVETNARAIGEITLMIEPSLYNYVEESTSAKVVWDGIAKAFDDSGTARKVSILNQLVSIKLKDHESMKKYVNEILLYWRKSKIAGFTIEEQVIASLMLGGLPEEYRAMILGIENSGKELTVDYVKTVLLQGIKDPFHEEKEEPVAFVAANGGNRACFICGSQYHLRYECPKGRACFRCGSKRHLVRECPETETESEEEEEEQDGENQAERGLYAI